MLILAGPLVLLYTREILIKSEITILPVLCSGGTRPLGGGGGGGIKKKSVGAKNKGPWIHHCCVDIVLADKN